MATGGFVVVGLAGHIDHGKTALVTALTGKNTDRLKEEQERGISIDIDFAPLYFPDGTIFGMVDVPGHERFVRNMVAGAVGIDAALFVVDVNEGVKPQTLEHATILDVLGVRDAIIALTKIDLAEQDWVDVAAELIREDFALTPFADAPMIATSVRTGQGLDALKEQLWELGQRASRKDPHGAFRLPIDKVFSIPGFGPVVTGTIWRGQVRVGDALDVLPGRLKARVRGIQSHGKPVESAVAGQRAALNLTGVEKNRLRRGVVAAAPGTLVETKLLDVQLSVSRTALEALHHRHRVHFHLGTGEVVGRILLLDADSIEPGHSGFAQVLLDSPVVCEANDLFVVRSYSPVTTIGGGQVLDPRPERLHRRRRSEVISRLASKVDASPHRRVLAMADQNGVVTADAAAAEVGFAQSEMSLLLQELKLSGEMKELSTGWTTKAVWERTLSMLREGLEGLHRKRRFEQNVPRALVANLPGLPIRHPKDMEMLFAEGMKRGWWTYSKEGVKAATWRVVLTPEESRILEDLISFVKEAGLAPAPIAELCARFPRRDKVARSLADYARAEGLFTPITDEVWVYQDALREACYKLSDFGDSGFRLGQARDCLGTSRQATLNLLEYLDKIGVTKRDGDIRRIVTQF